MAIRNSNIYLRSLRGAFLLHGAFAAEHVLDGFEDDAAVQADGPVLDILGVEADDLCGR